MRLATPLTYPNTSFRRWFGLAVAEFTKLCLATPSNDEAYQAYSLGETPSGWASFVANS